MPTVREVVDRFYELPALDELIAETVGDIERYMLPDCVAGEIEEPVVSWLWKRIRDTVAEAIAGEDTVETAIEAIMEYVLPPYVGEGTREYVRTWLRAKIRNTVATCASMWPSEEGIT